MSSPDYPGFDIDLASLICLHVKKLEVDLQREIGARESHYVETIAALQKDTETLGADVGAADKRSASSSDSTMHALRAAEETTSSLGIQDLRLKAPQQPELKGALVERSGSGLLHQEAVEPFELFPLWVAAPTSAKNLAERIADRLQYRTQSRLPRSNSKPNLIVELDLIPQPSSFTWPRTLVITPGSPFFLFWNILFVVFLFYELAVFPMAAFDLPQDVLYKMTFCTITYWTLDFAVSLNTGFQDKNGDIVKDRKKIAQRYMRTWMIPDVVIVGADWLMLLLTGGSGKNAAGVLRIGKLLRCLRVLRALRIIRLAKMGAIMETIDNLSNSDYFTVVKSIFLNVFAVLIMSHFAGCVWFTIGVDDKGWVHVTSFNDPSWLYKYLTSIHWALTQFTPGSMEVQPQNTQERAFAISVLLLGLIVFSSIVSSITTAINNLKSMNARYGKQIYLLRKYFRQQRLSVALMGRVSKYADTMIQPTVNKVSLKDVELLKMLPDNLCREVSLELYQPVLTAHPFFKLFFKLSRGVMQKLCANLTQVALSQDDELFAPGQAAQTMYFVQFGTLVYDMEDFGNDPVIVKAHDWFCEAALWTQWVHQGAMVATAGCDLVTLDGETFRNMMAHHRADLWLPRRYAKAFLQAVNSKKAFVDHEALNGEERLSDLMPPPEMHFLRPDGSNASAGLETRSAAHRGGCSSPRDIAI